MLGRGAWAALPPGCRPGQALPSPSLLPVQRVHAGLLHPEPCLGLGEGEGHPAALAVPRLHVGTGETQPETKDRT